MMIHNTLEVKRMLGKHSDFKQNGYSQEALASKYMLFVKRCRNGKRYIGSGCGNARKNGRVLSSLSERPAWKEINKRRSSKIK